MGFLLDLRPLSRPLFLAKNKKKLFEMIWAIYYKSLTWFFQAIFWWIPLLHQTWYRFSTTPKKHHKEIANLKKGSLRLLYQTVRHVEGMRGCKNGHTNTQHGWCGRSQGSTKLWLDTPEFRVRMTQFNVRNVNRTQISKLYFKMGNHSLWVSKIRVLIAGHRSNELWILSSRIGSCFIGSLTRSLRSLKIPHG